MGWAWFPITECGRRPKKSKSRIAIRRHLCGLGALMWQISKCASSGRLPCEVSPLIWNMGRILKAYETQFRWLLQEVGARRLDKGVQILVGKARILSATQRISLADSLACSYERVAGRCRILRPKAQPQDLHFFCDAGLGGLARWLRAAGYEAEWESGIDDDALLQKAASISATILTTDSMLMERRVVRDRLLPTLWVPPTLHIQQQLALVFREFGLAIRPPRCMNCGGSLVRVDKETMREQIPPRTYRWLEEFFTCSQCGKLLWQGTHWKRIRQKLQPFRERTITGS
jgi:uncharacterized protein with PIN domain